MCDIADVMRGRARLVIGLAAFAFGGCSKRADEPSLSSATRASPEVPSSSASGSADAEEPEKPRPRLEPAVTLSGSTNPVPLSIAAPGRPRVFARAFRLWIYARPTKSSKRLGYLRAGASSPTSDKPAGYEGCKHGWYSVEPDGYVCVGQARDAGRKRPHRSRHSGAPTGILTQAPVHLRHRAPPRTGLRAPSDDDELSKAEPDIEERMSDWLEAEGEVGASYAQDVWLGGAGEAARSGRSLARQDIESLAVVSAERRHRSGRGNRR